MQFVFLKKTYDSFGYCPVLSECGRRLAHSFGEIAFGLEAVEIVVWWETAEPTRPRLEGLRAQFELKIPQKPIARFEAKRQRFQLAYKSNTELVLKGDRYELQLESLDKFFREFVGVLESLRPTSLRKRGIDYEGFVESIRASETSVCAPSNGQTMFLYEGKSRSLIAPWWERFGIDWSRYHPQAREILDDPFYWDPANDDSPHAATAGAGFLADFRRWRVRRPADPPWDFLVQQFRRSGCLERLREFRATDPINYAPRDRHIAEWHDRDVIALAFALLKIDGVCDKKVGTAALQALARCCDVDIAARLGKHLTPKSIAVASKLQNDLSERI